MKLLRYQSIWVANYVMKPHIREHNYGLVISNYNEAQGQVLESTKCWVVLGEACVAINNEVCPMCRRIYGFNKSIVYPTCICFGKE